MALALSLVILAAPAHAALSRAQVRDSEARLSELGYWTGPVDGVWDGASRQALIAFQRVRGARPTGLLTRVEVEALAAAPAPRPKETNGFHIEVDLARQVLFLVDAEGRIGNALPISSGSGRRFHQNGYPETHAVTPCAHLEVFSKVRGWRKSPLGVMYNPLYIVGGIAIHGSQEMSAHPASHGCIRIPMYAANRLFDMVPLKTPVYVYGCKEE